MATYTLKRKLYSGQEDSGMSTGAKIGLGVLGTAGVAAGTFAGARRGYLGTKALRSTNNMWAKVGSKIGGNTGTKMINNAANKVGNSTKNNVTTKLTEKATKGLAEGESLSQSTLDNIKNKAEAKGNAMTEAFNKKWLGEMNNKK